jgi:oxaloacetate decarboxylase gamma subunit
MTVSEMFGQSLIVTLLGMGVVFGFLIILIITITCAGKVIHSLGWDAAPQTQAKSPGPSPAPGPVPATNNAIPAVIAAAVAEYRKTHS